MSDMLSIGLRSLVTYKNALGITGNNISNVATPYYSRKEISLVAALSKNGVNIGSVNRIYDNFLSKNLRSANSEVAENEALYQTLSQLENLLQSDKDNIGAYLNDAVKAIREVGLDGSTTNRATFLNRLSTLTSRINSLGDQIQKEKANVFDYIKANVKEVNSLTSQLASINTNIFNNNGGDNSDLFDQQEQLLQKLSQYLDFTTTTDEKGVTNVMLKNGISLVDNNKSYELTTKNNPKNSSEILVSIKSQTSSLDVTDAIQSGSLSGLYQSLQALKNTQASLDKFALTIAQRFDQQNKLGVDVNGNLGKSIFKDLNTIALQNSRVIASANNTGNEDVKVSIADADQLTLSDYSLKFDASNHYILTRLTDNQVVSSATISSLPLSIAIDGMQIDISNTSITSGDQFYLSPTKGASASLKISLTDPHLLALASPINISANSANQGKGSLSIGKITDINNSSFSVAGQLSPPLQIHFTSANSFELINATTHAVLESNIPYDPATGLELFPTPGAYDPGYRISLKGMMQADDTFDIQYNAKSLGNLNTLEFEDLLTKGSLKADYQLFAGDVSLQANHAKIQLDSFTTIQTQATSRYEQLSGVSLEEEMANFELYQEAYQASAKILEVARDVFAELIAIARR